MSYYNRRRFKLSDKRKTFLVVWGTLFGGALAVVAYFGILFWLSVVFWPLALLLFLVGATFLATLSVNYDN